MYLDGIKFGDYQVTITGVLMSVCFLSISRAKVRRCLFRFCNSDMACCIACREVVQTKTTGQYLQFLRPALRAVAVFDPYCHATLHDCIV